MIALSDFASFLPNAFSGSAFCSGQTFSSGPDRGRHLLLCQSPREVHSLCSHCHCLLLSSLTCPSSCYLGLFGFPNLFSRRGRFAFTGSIHLPYLTLSFPRGYVHRPSTEQPSLGSCFHSLTHRTSPFSPLGVHCYL